MILRWGLDSCFYFSFYFIDGDMSWFLCCGKLIVNPFGQKRLLNALNVNNLKDSFQFKSVKELFITEEVTSDGTQVLYFNTILSISNFFNFSTYWCIRAFIGMYTYT